MPPGEPDGTIDLLLGCRTQRGPRLQRGPFGAAHLRALAQAMATGGEAPRYPWPVALLRNLALYPVILAHGFRRLLPG